MRKKGEIIVMPFTTLTDVCEIAHASAYRPPNVNISSMKNSGEAQQDEERQGVKRRKCRMLEEYEGGNIEDAEEIGEEYEGQRMLEFLIYKKIIHRFSDGVEGG